MMNILFPYQNQQIKRLIRELKERGIALLASAVGSGKTLVSKIIISEVVKPEILGIKKVIIATPFLTIGKEFETLEEDQIWNSPANSSYNASSYIVKGNSFEFIDNNSRNALKSVISSISYPTTIFSHATLASISSIPSSSFSDTLLVIDEAHHCFHDDYDEELSEKIGTKLGKVINSAIKKGAKVLYLTATPFRTVGSKTIPIVNTDTCNPVIRTIGEQISDEYSPKLEVEYIKIKGDTAFIANRGNKKSTIIDGPDVHFSSQEKAIVYAEYIYEQWIKDGCPKSIIVIPQGESKRCAEAIKKYFDSKIFPKDVSRRRGRIYPTILNAVGTISSDKEKIIDEIQQDKKEYGHRYDIAIGCVRFNEGTDLPSASHIYMIGVPRSLRLLTQRPGRVLRSKEKIMGYENWFGNSWLKKAKAVFFIPLFVPINKLENQVARQLLHCIFAGENYQGYCDSINTRIAFKKATEDLFKINTNKHEKEIQEVFNTLDAFEMNNDYSTSKFALNIAIEAKKGDMSVGDFCEKILSSYSDPEDKLKVKVALLNNLSCITSKHIQELSGEVVKNMIGGLSLSGKSKKDRGIILRPGDKIFREELNLNFNILINKFKNKKVTLKSDNYVDKVLVNLSGEDFKYWVEQCNFLYDNEELSKERITELCEWIKNNNNNTPNQKSIDPVESMLGTVLTKKRQATQGRGGCKFYPSDQEIAERYGYPDLFKIIDLEEESNKKTVELCEWVKNNNSKLPNSESSNDEEKKHRKFLGVRRQAFRGKGSWKFYPSDQEIAERYGYPDLFKIIDLEEESNKKTVELCEWVKNNNGNTPRCKCENEEEEKLGTFLMGKRGALQGKGEFKFYSSDQEIAERYGYPDLFKIIDLEEESNKKTVELCEWVKNNNGNTPRCKCENEEEEKLGTFLMGKKQAFKNKGSCKFYSSDQEIAERYGYPDLFKITDLEEESNKKVIELCEWMKSNNSEPSQKSNNITECKLGRFLGTRRKAFQKKQRSKLYSSDQEIAERYGYPDLFKVQGLEEKSNKKVIELCEWMKNNNDKIPTRMSNDMTEIKHQRFLNKKRQATQGRGHGTIFYLSDQDIATKFGYKDLFKITR